MPDRAEPNRPQPSPVSVESARTAVLVLDLGMRAVTNQEAGTPLLAPVGAFLERARARGIPIIYTLVVSEQGTPHGEVAAPLKRRPEEPLFFPTGYDKLRDERIQSILEGRNVDTVIVAGASTNFAVLYTCTTAARIHGYRVIVPLDGVRARNEYEQEYALHQMTVLPALPRPIEFTTLSQIELRPSQFK